MSQHDQLPDHSGSGSSLGVRVRGVDGGDDLGGCGLLILGGIMIMLTIGRMADQSVSQGTFLEWVNRHLLGTQLDMLTVIWWGTMACLVVVALDVIAAFVEDRMARKRADEQRVRDYFEQAVDAARRAER